MKRIASTQTVLCAECDQISILSHTMPNAGITQFRHRSRILYR